MTTLRAFPIVALLALASLAAPATAAPCAGFNDVDSTNGFCPNVEWLKNRGVTVGCTSTSFYCPNLSVTRAQMAAFLNRLGNALSPIPLHKADTWSFGFPTLDLDSNAIACPLSAPFQVTGSPRLAHGAGFVLGGLGSGTGTFQVQVVERVNDGPWTPVSSPRRGTSIENTLVSVGVLLPPRSLDVGSVYNYGLRVSRAPGDASVNPLANWSCVIHVQLENRNATTSPLDEAD